MSTTSCGLSVATAAGLAVSCGWISSIIVLLMERKSLYVVAWAYQMIVFSAPWTIVCTIAIIISYSVNCIACLIIFWIFLLIYFMIWSILFYKAVIRARIQDADDFFRLPVIGNWAWQKAVLFVNKD